MFSFCCALLCVIFDRMSMMEEKENLRLLLFVFAYRDTHTHILHPVRGISSKGKINQIS